MRRRSTNPEPRAGRRSGLLLAATLLIGLLSALGASPSEAAAITGIKGLITDNSGAPVPGVAVDLFVANADGSRSTFLGKERTGDDGYYWFGPGDGCYVITMIAPATVTFVGSNGYFQRGICVSGGGMTQARIDAVLNTGGVTAPPTPACNSGQPIWNLTLDEQFSGNGAPLPSAWNAYNWGGNAGYGLRRPSALSLWGGSLNIRASMENGTLVSGGVSHKVSQTYGRYEFRVRTDKDPSETTSAVVLTWPQSNTHPRDGENNMYETLWAPGDRHEFYSFIHKPFGSQTDQEYMIHPADASQWHTIVMEWLPNRLTIFRDGAEVSTIWETSADLIPDVPHFMAIQLDSWKHSIPAPVWMQIDYAKVWSYGGTTTC